MSLWHLLKRRAGDGAGQGAGHSVLLFVALGVLAGAPPVRAETPSAAPTIVVDPQLRLPAGGEAPFPIRITNMEALPRQTVVLIKGLPQGIELSQGQSFGSDVWVVAINRLSGLKASIPDGFAGRAEISFTIATLEGKYLAAQRMILIVDRPAPAALPLATGSLPITPAPIRLTQEARELAIKLMISGHDSLQLGNVLVARQFYQRAAEQGLPEGASALAATYDPAELARMSNLVGVQPNAELARRWYEMADRLRKDIQR